MCWLKSLTLRFTAPLLSLRTEAMGRWRWRLLQVIGGWTHKPRCSKANPNPGSWAQALWAYHCPLGWRPERLAQTLRGADGTPPPPHIHQSSHNREGKAASGYLDHLGDCPWAAITLFSAQQYKTCLWKKYILAKTLLLVRCEGWWGGGFRKVGWRNHVLSVVSSSNVWFGFKMPLCSAFSALPTKSPHKSVYHQIAFWLPSHTTCTLQIPRPGLCPTGSSISSYEDKMSVAAEKFSPMLFTLFTVQYWYITILHLIIINNDT